MHRRQIVLLFSAVALTLGWAHGIDAQHQPAGELVYAMHVTLAPSWFDPAENVGLITPFAVLGTISPSIWWHSSAGPCYSEAAYSARPSLGPYT